MKHISQGVKVGMLVLFVTIAGYKMWKTISERDGSGGYLLWARFRDATGLAGKSRVVIAGLTVGEIESRRLEGRFARVNIRMRNGTEIWSNAAIFKKSSSLLGEFYLEVDPGSPETVREDGGVDKNRLLTSGEEIKRVVEAATPDELMRRMTEVIPHVDDVITEVRGLTADVRKVVAGPVTRIAENLDKTVDDNQEILHGIMLKADRVLASIEGIAADVRHVTGGSTDKVGRILENVEAVTAEVKLLVADTHKEVNLTGDAVRNKLHNIDAALDNLNKTFASSASVAEKIDSDQGTLGRLVNDPTIADNVEEITTSAQGFVQTVFNLQTIVGLRTEYSFATSLFRSYAAIEFQTRHDKFYLVELVADPRGSLSSEIVVDSDEPGQVTRTQTFSDDFRFSFQFGKRFDWLSLRMGLKESTGGVGVDADLFDNRLHLATDVFDASFDKYPRLKFLAAFEFFKYLYVLAGIDDVLNTPAEPEIAGGNVTGRATRKYKFGRDLFGGVMLRFNDQDLAALLTVGGSALSAGSK